MNDVRELLTAAAGEGHSSDGVVDDDLARARAGLRRRTSRRAGVLVLTCAAMAAVVVSGGQVAQPPGDVASRPQPSRQEPAAAGQDALGTVLVAYTGAQPSGYRVGFVPQGWEIQGANEFSMTIAPVGADDTHPDSFVGKLVVMLQSADASGRPAGERVDVGGRQGYLSREEPTAILTFHDESGQWAQVQVPPGLQWTDEQITDFAAGVEVTGDANAARG